MTLTWKKVKCCKCGKMFLKGGGGVVPEVPQLWEKEICFDCKMNFYKKGINDIARIFKRT